MVFLGLISFTDWSLHNYDCLRVTSQSVVTLSFLTIFSYHDIMFNTPFFTFFEKSTVSMYGCFFFFFFLGGGGGMRVTKSKLLNICKRMRLTITPIC